MTWLGLIIVAICLITLAIIFPPLWLVYLLIIGIIMIRD